jgi:hypothetical protein
MCLMECFLTMTENFCRKPSEIADDDFETPSHVANVKGGIEPHSINSSNDDGTSYSGGLLNRILK